MNKFTFAYEPGKGQFYRSGGYTILIQVIGYSHLYKAYAPDGTFLTAEPMFTEAANACERHSALNQ